MPRFAHFAAAFALLGAAAPLQLPASSFAQSTGPFAVTTPARYERERDYDLQNVLLRIRLDWEHKTFSGVVTHTLSPLRDNLPHFDFDIGPDLVVKSCAVGSAPARFEKTGDRLSVFPTARYRHGQIVTVTIRYASTPPARGRRSLNGSYGFHWIAPDKYAGRPPGFYTQGESEGNHEWVPIYDYPNEKATSEVYCEAPADWFVIGNGRLMGISSNAAAKTRTFHWKMTQPHAPYLLSLIGGQMDVRRDSWEGVDLYYAVPRGEGKYIPASFGDTKDMLTFFSSVLGVKYAWPKYAQTATFDFGGGMENVSATTLGEGSLVEARSGIWPMATLNSHELAHQWFGDLITTRDWGNIWLNEGFATYFEMAYVEHSRGKDHYDSEREGALRAYLNEARRYHRPIVTAHYPSPDAMFDSHTYPRGGLTLHMLRRELGDADFYRGLGYYLRKYAYTSVDTHDLIRAFEESTGRSLQPWFDQWVYKPGHPVIDWSWKYDDAAKQVTLQVGQVQDTKDGTPIYRLPLSYLLIGPSGSTTAGQVVADKEKNTFTISAPAGPAAVLIDPGHDLLIERKSHTYSAGEQRAIVRSAPCWLDRRDAALALLRDAPADDVIAAVAATVPSGGRDDLYTAAVVNRLGALKKESLRPLYERLLGSPVDTVRTAAVTALGSLPKTDADAARVRELVNQKEYFDVCRAAMNALAGWDADSYLETLAQPLQWDSRGETLRVGAINAVARSKSDRARDLLLGMIAPRYARSVRQAAVFQFVFRFKDSPQVTEKLTALLRTDDPEIAKAAAGVLRQRGDKSAVPALRDLEKTTRDASLRDTARSAADTLEGK